MNARDFFLNEEKMGWECGIMFLFGIFLRMRYGVATRPADVCSGHFLRFSMAIEEVI